MATNAKYLQVQKYTLAGAGVTMGGTTVLLTSMLKIDGVTTVTMADFGNKGFATLEPGNGTQEEQISFTGITQNANGTASLTGVSNVDFASPYTETSGLAQSHPGGVTLVISNTSGFYNQFVNKSDDATITQTYTFTNPNYPQMDSASPPPINDVQLATKKYVDDTATFGAPDASNTTKGIAKLSVAAASPTDPIAVGDNDTRVPTQTEADALVGSSGTPSTSNPYVTLQDQTGGNSPSGAIIMYGGSAAPTGWLLCDGASVLRATYANLFTALGTAYGSADGTHFNVPDMRGRAPVGVGTGTGGGASGTGAPTGGSALTAVARGTWKGEETHTLTIPEMPAHTHGYTAPNTAAASSGGGVNCAGGAATTASTGGDGAHNNIQPITGLNFIIKT